MAAEVAGTAGKVAASEVMAVAVKVAVATEGAMISSILPRIQS